MKVCVVHNSFMHHVCLRPNPEKKEAEGGVAFLLLSFMTGLKTELSVRATARVSSPLSTQAKMSTRSTHSVEGELRELQQCSCTAVVSPGWC